MLEAMLMTVPDVTSADEASTLAEVILQSARDALENPALDLSDRVATYSSDTRKIIRIIRDVKAKTGTELSLTTFAGQQTIAQIGAALAKGETRTPLTVQLRPGVGTPIFLVPGISGATVEMLRLANSLGTESPVYGLAYPGLDGHAKPVESIVEMARLLHAEIVSVVGHKLIHIVGYSAGGCIAVELARLQGPTKIGFLGLIEAPVHSRHWPLGIWLSFIRSGRKKAAVSAERSGPALKATPQVVPPNLRAPGHKFLGAKASMALFKLWCVFDQRYGSVADGKFLKTFIFRVDNLPDRIQGVRDATIRAMGYACPRRYDGPASYFRTAGGDSLMCEPSLVWSSILPRAEFVDVSGRHASVLSMPHVQDVGNQIGKRLMNQ